MKSRFLMIVAAALLTAEISLSAAETAKTQEDTWFDMIVQAEKQNLPAGAELRYDAKLRYIILNMKLPVQSAKLNYEQFVTAAKAAMLKNLKAKEKNTPIFDFYKKTRTSMIFNYITEDAKIYTVIISSQEF